MFGEGARFDILGVANLDTPTTTGGTITGASIVMNGAFFDGIGLPESPEDAVSLTAYKATAMHEVGHFLNLDHSVVNHEIAADGDPDNDIYLPTMYPTAVDDDEALATLNPDDQSNISVLYPDATFATATAAFTGRIFSARFHSGSWSGGPAIGRPATTPIRGSGRRLLPCNPRSRLSCSAATACSAGNPPEQGEYGLWDSPGTYHCASSKSIGGSPYQRTFIGPWQRLHPARPEECYSAQENGTSGDDPDDSDVLAVAAGEVKGP
jgi:hypothetical protein